MKIKPSEIKGGHHFALTKKADEGGAARRCYLKWAETDISHLNVQQFLSGPPIYGQPVTGLVM